MTLDGSLIRKLIRVSAIGKVALKIRHMQDVGICTLLRAAWNEKKILPQISSAKPLDVCGTYFVIHMLLNHDRRFEGAWALYSFVIKYSGEVGICVHDDGTLTGDDKAMLRHLFRGIRIIDRAIADRIVYDELERRGLGKVADFRRGLVLSLKLVDPVLLGASKMRMVLDSDILFFDRPHEIEQMVQSGRNGYSVDFGFVDGYCAGVARKVKGKDDVAVVNSGIVIIKDDAIDLARVEVALSHAELWSNESPNWFAEQAAFCIEMNSIKADALSSRYAIVGRTLKIADYDAVHFCASSARRRLFYSDGLPAVLRSIVLQVSPTSSPVAGAN
jgi:hypothetical protein